MVQHHQILRYEDPQRIFNEEDANAALVEGPGGIAFRPPLPESALAVRCRDRTVVFSQPISLYPRAGG